MNKYSSVIITILVDNNTYIDQYLLGEPGFSALVEIDGLSILFDAGYSDVFLHNAEKMKIDLTTIDGIALSHGHLDHTWGLEPLMRMFTETEFFTGSAAKKQRPFLIAHPLALTEKHGTPIPHQFGNIIAHESLETMFDLRLSRKPRQISEHMTFLGEIPRVTPFEPAIPLGMSANQPDYLLDDSALAIRTAEGLVILTGCSHAGIGNIITYAQQVMNEQRVVDIIGGLHLLNPAPEKMQGTIDLLKGLRLHALHACHCTDLSAKLSLGAALPLKEVGSGLRLKFELSDA